MCRGAIFTLGLLAIFIRSSCDEYLHGQASIFSGGTRAFVTGFVPVIGPNGGVGGVEVDADGVLSRVETERHNSLASARMKAAVGIAGDIRRRSAMRKISLRRLEEAIERQATRQQALDSELLFLAGLQRIEYVFVYPEQNDIVIAGPAEGWGPSGDTMVGATSRQAVLRLDDLLDALQAALGPSGRQPITCSIDPAPAGMARLKQATAGRNVQFTAAGMRRLEQQLGDHLVTVTGVRPTSHFARVMVAADYRMKRIAMDLDESPLNTLPSYLELLQRGGGSQQPTAPRWWLAADYNTLLNSEDSLAWRLQGRGLIAKTEHGYLNDRGELIETGKPSPLAQQWANQFTQQYDALAAELPVFGQLRTCVDLVVVATLIRKQSLRLLAECPLETLTDPSKLTGEEFAVPKSVPSQARALRGRRGWVVSVSGGVDLNAEPVVAHAVTDRKLAAIRDKSAHRGRSWWWD